MTIITIDAVFTIVKVLLGVAILAEVAKKNYQEAGFLSVLLIITVFLIK